MISMYKVLTIETHKCLAKVDAILGETLENLWETLENLWETRRNLGKLGETQALNEGPVLNLINVKLVKQEKYLRGNYSTKNYGLR